MTYRCSARFDAGADAGEATMTSAVVIRGIDSMGANTTVTTAVASASGIPDAASSALMRRMGLQVEL